MSKQKSKLKVVGISIMVLVLLIGLFIGIFMFSTKISFGTTAMVSAIQNNPKLDEKLREEVIKEVKASGTVQASISEKEETKIKVIIESKNNEELIKEEKLQPSTRIDEINIIAEELTPNQLLNISKSDSIEMIYLDKEVKSYLSTSVNNIMAEPSVVYTKNNFGSGVKVCIIDTGIDDTHQYIGDIPLDHKKSFIEGLSSFDGEGHGTHVAGIIMSSKKRATSIEGGYEDGVAPNVDLYIAKSLDNDGAGSTSTVLAGLFWCINEVHADIVSLSLGGGLFTGTCDEEYECQYFNELSDKSIIVVASGNSGSKGGGSPACCSKVISVASFDKKGLLSDSNRLSSFSSRNNNLKIGAIGRDVTSTIPNNQFASLSGTSMATPHISGAFALLKSLKPTATNQELIDAMLSTAIDEGYESYEQGKGLASVYGACEKLIGDCSGIFKQDYATPNCGNNVKEENEECDGKDVRITCLDLNLSIGNLKCTDSCQFDYSSCGVSECVTDSECKQKSEISCTQNSDGTSYRTISTKQPSCSNSGFCIDFGVPTEISKEICNKEKICSKSGCITENNHCGDDIIGALEQCSGDNLGGKTCASLGLLGGQLSCNSLCNYDTSKCYKQDNMGKVFFYNKMAYDFEYGPFNYDIDKISKSYTKEGNPEFKLPDLGGKYEIYFAESCGKSLSAYSYSGWSRIYIGTSCYDTINENTEIETPDGVCNKPKLLRDNVPTIYGLGRLYACSEKNVLLLCEEAHDEILFSLFHKTSGTYKPATPSEVELRIPLELRCSEKETSINCIDTDGLDIGNAGEVRYKEKLYKDTCKKSGKKRFASDGDSVIEYYCNKDIKKQNEIYCGAGIPCVNGGCIIIKPEPSPETPIQTGDYVSFRTSDLGYGKGSAIATIFYFESCGSWLTKYGFVSKSSTRGTCDTDKNLGPLLLSGLPTSNTFNSKGDGNLSLYLDIHDWQNTVWICEDDVDGRGLYKARYTRQDSDANKVSHSRVKSGSNKEATCSIK